LRLKAHPNSANWQLFQPAPQINHHGAFCGARERLLEQATAAELRLGGTEAPPRQIKIKIMKTHER
jgi:hypothetical protein